jgi:hypothetical protein
MFFCLQVELCEAVEGSDRINIKGRPGILGATLGWKMNRVHYNRCLMAVAGALFDSSEPR